ncbi:MAG: DUF4363 family protein [Caldicoprobacterales bacterium]|jgi:hypothetical protein|nr:DUF4363 family protein [Clostridiales bacterium]
MRSFIIILVVMLLFLGLSWWNTSYLTRTSEELLSQAEKVRDKVKKEAWEDASSEVMQIRRLWGKHKKTWLLLIDHEDIDNIDKTIYRIDEMVSQKEKEQSLTDIAELRFLVQDLADKEVLSLANIF